MVRELLIRKGGSKRKGMFLLTVIKEDANSGSFIFWPNFRTVLRSMYNSKDFSGNTCALGALCVLHIGWSQGLWQE